jgi:hypothetical protein
VSENQGQRAGNGSIDRVILHITGIRDFDAIVRRFTERSGAASAHYLVMPDGLVHQFGQLRVEAASRRLTHPVFRAFGRQGESSLGDEGDKRIRKDGRLGLFFSFGDVNKSLFHGLAHPK